MLMRWAIYYLAMLLLGAVTALPARAGGHALTLDNAVEWALTQSEQVIATRLRALIARADLEVTRGVYDHRISASGRYQDSQLPMGSAPFLLQTRGAGVDVGIARVFDSGTRIELGASAEQFRYPAGDGFLLPDEVHVGMVQATVAQPLLRNAWGRLNRRQTAAAEDRWQASLRRHEATRLAVAGAVHSLYWDAYAASAGYAANRRALQYAADLVEVMERRVRDHLQDETDLLAAEAALASREVDLLSRRHRAQQAQERLLEFIGWPIEYWQHTKLVYPERTALEPVPREESESERFQQALAHRSELAALHHESHASQRDLDAAEQALRPDLSVMASYGVGDRGDDAGDAWRMGRQAWAVGLRFETSIERRAEQARIRQAAYQLEQVDQQQIAMTREIYREIREALRGVQTAQAQITAAAKALALHERKWQLEEEKLVQGRSTAETVIRFQEDRELAEYAYIQALTAYQQARVMLDTASGVLLSGAGETP